MNSIPALRTTLLKLWPFLKERTIGDRFKELSYGLVYQSHLGYCRNSHPLKRGFDEYFGFCGAHDY